MKSLVFLSCLFVFVFGDECPPAVLLKPCRCDEGVWPVAIVCSNITDVATLHRVFETSGDWPTALPIGGAAVASKGMWYVTIRDSTLTSLFDASPAPNNKVSHINLFDVKFQRGIRWDLMANLRELLDIKIESSEFRKLGSDFADNVSVGLRKFMMDGTKTTSLDDHVFARMKAMDRVHFRNCKIATLKRSMFANPSRLFTFDFRGNEIETLPDDMFHGMERLDEILLDGNRIKYFSESLFGGNLFEVVGNIQITDNPIICDCSIRWYTQEDRYIRVDGYCAGPEDKKGRHFGELDPGWFNYCPKSNSILDAMQ